MTDDEKAAWLSSRAGKLTASRMADAMARKKDGSDTADRFGLKKELLAERLTGDSVPHYVNALMQWGLDQEPIAKTEYELATGELLMPCGFIDHPEIDMFGATPDGLIDGGVIEFKCPQTTTHLGWVLAGGVPDQHKPQILAQLACTGRERAVFVSFDPRIRDPRRQLYIVEWTPKREEIQRVEEEAAKFLGEVEKMFAQITETA
jgi:putative phage-type endonuclease